MNEFDAWQRILEEHRAVNRMKRLNQELYDLLGGAIIENLEYSKKHGIPLKDREVLYRTAGRIHKLMDEINRASDELLQAEKTGASDENYTEPFHTGFKLQAGGVRFA